MSISFFQQRHGGFTLVELVTTIVIVGILGAVALPQLFENQTFSERGYMDEIASATRYAQKIAVASGCEASVQISSATYSVSQRNSLVNCNAAAAPWTTQVRRPDGTVAGGSAPAGVTSAPATTVVFRADGKVSANPPVILVGPFTMTIAANSGMVTVTP